MGRARRPSYSLSCWIGVSVLSLACGAGDPALGDDETAQDESGDSVDSQASDSATESSASDASESASASGTGDGDGDGDLPVDWDAAFDHLFPQDHVVQVQINPPPGDWAAMLASWDLNAEKPYYEASFSFDDETLDSIGFRLKGWSSLSNGSGPGGGPIGDSSQPGGKFPLKVDFDRFGGPRFHEIGKYNLSNNWADLSYMREALSNRAYRSMGVPAARTGYARVRVDGNDNGLYTAVQQIDRCFLEEHFGVEGGNGNLYKAVFTNTEIGALTWQGDQATDYWSTSTCPSNFAECGLILKTNEDDPAMNDYADLIAFIDVLNHSSDAEFPEAIEAVFDVDSFLRLAAVSATLSSFDGYFGMGHNYYLYHRPDTDKFMMLPWDHNESYAGHPCYTEQQQQNAITFDVDDPVCNQRGHEFILSDRILAVPAYKAQYLEYVQALTEGAFSEAQQVEWITQFNDLIRDEVASDPNYIQDLNIFDRALGYDPPNGPNLGGHGGTEYNLMYFVTQRQAAIQAML